MECCFFWNLDLIQLIAAGVIRSITKSKTDRDFFVKLMNNSALRNQISGE